MRIQEKMLCAKTRVFRKDEEDFHVMIQIQTNFKFEFFENVNWKIQGKQTNNLKIFEVVIKKR